MKLFFVTLGRVRADKKKQIEEEEEAESEKRCR